MAPERQCRRESHSCVLAPFYFVVAAKLVSDGVLRSMGRKRQSMTATFTNLILRVVLAFDLSKLWGVTGIWLSWPIGWSVATVMSLFFYNSDAGVSESNSINLETNLD